MASHSGPMWSDEKLPRGKNRCPNCAKVHDIDSSRVGSPPKRSLEPGAQALVAYMEELGAGTDYVRCPNCGTRYMLTHSPDVGESKQAEPPPLSPPEAVPAQDGSAMPTRHSGETDDKAEAEYRSMSLLFPEGTTYDKESIENVTPRQLRGALSHAFAHDHQPFACLSTDEEEGLGIIAMAFDPMPGDVLLYYCHPHPTPEQKQGLRKISNIRKNRKVANSLDIDGSINYLAIKPATREEYVDIFVSFLEGTAFWRSYFHLEPLREGESVLPARASMQPRGGWKCFIATAACGPLSPEVTVLRDYRDATLCTTRFGRACISAYERLSPPLAKFIASSGVSRWIARVVIVRPLAALVKRSTANNEVEAIVAYAPKR